MCHSSPRSRFRDARCSRDSAPPWRCRCSTPWCPRAGLWTQTAQAAALDRTRLVCIEMVHGAAGSCEWGASQHLWSPAAAGRAFDLAPSALSPLEPFRKYLTIVSDTDVRGAEAVTQPEIGGDHFRSSAVFLTQTHPEADRELGRARRHLARSDLRDALRTGHADSLDAAVHRERRSGGRLRLRLLVRLHRHDQLGVADRAAADDPRSAHGVRSAVRRRRLDEGARGAAARHDQRARLHHRAGGRSQSPARPERSAAHGSLPGRRARGRAADSEGRGAQHERRGPRAAGRAGRRARLVRRARQADVRPAGAGVPGGRHARLLVQDGPRRVEPRLSGERRHQGLPSRRRITATSRRTSPSSARSTAIT